MEHGQGGKPGTQKEQEEDSSLPDLLQTQICRAPSRPDSTNIKPDLSLPEPTAAKVTLPLSHST